MAGERRCPRCEASIADGLAWCGQCFAPIPPDTPVTATGLQARLRPQAPPVLAVADPQQFSRWGSSATSFGPAGRILLTFGLILGLIAGFPIGLGGVTMIVGDIPAQGFLAVYLVVAVPGGLWCASLIWRSVRVA